jgi:hypothetical protein
MKSEMQTSKIEATLSLDWHFAYGLVLKKKRKKLIKDIYLFDSIRIIAHFYQSKN